jgi:hypothetical protein
MFNFRKFFDKYITNFNRNDYDYDYEKNTNVAVMQRNNNDKHMVTVSSSYYDGFIFHFNNDDNQEFSVNFSNESFKKYPEDCLRYVEKRIMDMTYDTGNCEILSFHLPKYLYNKFQEL